MTDEQDHQAISVAIIPARGGSKRIPKKNIRPFCGKPIIAYSIETALASKCFDKVIVTTDDEEMAALAKSYGAEIPFLRPPELADDYTPTVEVINHALRTLAEEGDNIQFACCIYATAPFIEVSDLIASKEKLIEHDASYVFAATEFPFPIQRAIKLSDECRVDMFQPEHYSTRSQDLEKAYHDVGQFYWGKTESFLSLKPFFSHEAVAHIIPRIRSQDIDTEEDWGYAEALFKLCQKSSASIERHCPEGNE